MAARSVHFLALILAATATPISLPTEPACAANEGGGRCGRDRAPTEPACEGESCRPSEVQEEDLVTLVQKKIRTSHEHDGSEDKEQELSESHWWMQPTPCTCNDPGGPQDQCNGNQCCGSGCASMGGCWSGVKDACPKPTAPPPPTTCGQARARALGDQHIEFKKLYDDHNGQDTTMHDIFIAPSGLEVVYGGCMDKKNTPMEVFLPMHFWKPGQGDRKAFCQGYVKTEHCERARKGYGGRRRASWDAFYNCARTCAVCANPLMEQAANCEKKAKTSLTALAKKLPAQPKPRLAPGEPTPKQRLDAKMKAMSHQGEDDPSTSALVEQSGMAGENRSSRLGWSMPWWNKNPQEPEVKDQHELDKLIGSFLQPAMDIVTSSCGTAAKPTSCAPWCKMECVTRTNMDGSFCCKGGSLGCTACHGCDFCKYFDGEAFLSDAFNNKQKAGSALQSKSEVLAKADKRAWEPGFIFEVGLSFVPLFAGVSVSIGVYGGFGAGFQRYYVLGGQITEQPAQIGFGVALSIAGLGAFEGLGFSSSVSCALGYGLSFDPGFSFLDTMAAGCAAATAGLCGPIAAAAAFVDAGFGLTTGFACANEQDGYGGCLSEPPQVCNVGATFSISAEVDIVPVFDFSLGFGRACPFKSSTAHGEGPLVKDRDCPLGCSDKLIQRCNKWHPF